MGSPFGSGENLIPNTHSWYGWIYEASWKFPAPTHSSKSFLQWWKTRILIFWEVIRAEDLSAPSRKHFSVTLVNMVLHSFLFIVTLTSNFVPFTARIWPCVNIQRYSRSTFPPTGHDWPHCISILDLVDTHQKLGKGSLHAHKITRWKTNANDELWYRPGFPYYKKWFFRASSTRLGE